MKFWDLFKKEEKEKVKVKNLTLTYYEIHQVINKIDEEYIALLKTSQGGEVGRCGKLVLSKVRRSFKSFIKNKYGIN